MIGQNKRSQKFKKIVLSLDGAVVNTRMFCLFGQGLVGSRAWEDGRIYMYLIYKIIEF